SSTRLHTPVTSSKVLSINSSTTLYGASLGGSSLAKISLPTLASCPVAVSTRPSSHSMPIDDWADFVNSRRTLLPPSFGGSNSWYRARSEEHTSELQSRFDLVCRLLLEK